MQIKKEGKAETVTSILTGIKQQNGKLFFFLINVVFLE